MNKPIDKNRLNDLKSSYKSESTNQAFSDLVESLRSARINYIAQAMGSVDHSQKISYIDKAGAIDQVLQHIDRMIA